MNDYEQAPHKSHKNTKKWCKGKVGIEHKYGDWYDKFPTMIRIFFQERRCEVCGKKDWNVEERTSI